MLEVGFNSSRGVHQQCLTVLEICFDHARGMCSNYVLTVLDRAGGMF